MTSPERTSEHPQGEATPRVRVTSSRTAASTTTPAPQAPVATDIAEQTALGEVYVSGLIRAQLRLSVLLLAVAVISIGGFPLLMTLAPGTRSLSLGPLPFPWLVLAVGMYPVMWALAQWYDRQATQLDDEFASAVDQPVGVEPVAAEAVAAEPITHSQPERSER